MVDNHKFYIGKKSPSNLSGEEEKPKKKQDAKPARNTNLDRDTKARRLAGEACENYILPEHAQQVVVQDYKDYLEELGSRNNLISDSEWKNFLENAYTSKAEFDKLTGSERRNAILFLAYLTFIEGTGPRTQRHLEQAFKEEERKKDMWETFAKQYYPFFRLLADQQKQEARDAAGALYEYVKENAKSSKPSKGSMLQTSKIKRRVETC